MINENNEQDEQTFETRVVSRDSSSIRSARSKIRRRPALLYDHNPTDDLENHCIRIFNNQVLNNETDTLIAEMGLKRETESVNNNTLREPDVDFDNYRNSFDAAAIEERLKEMDDYIAMQESDGDIASLDNGEDIQTGPIRPSESAENLLSMFIDVDNVKDNTLTNIKQLFQHESAHLRLLTAIQQYKYILQESKVHDDVIWNIFYNISDLIYAQKSLVNYLESMVTEYDNFTVHFTEIMDLYSLLHVKCKDYAKNIPIVVRELKQLFEKNEKFMKAIYTVNFEGKSMRLEDLISKPTHWLCNSLEHIKNLINSADGEHDRQKLVETLQILKDNPDNQKRSNKNTLEKNNFLKSSLFVEQLSNDQRKLRHLFLFSGMVVCAKQKLQSDCCAIGKHVHTSSEDKCSTNKSLLEMKSIERFDVKWFITLNNIVFHLSKHVESSDRKKNDISILKDKIRDLKLQLINEKNKLSSDIDQSTSKIVKRSISNNFSFRKMMIKKDVDKFSNQILKMQTELLLISPTIAFVISHGAEKPHTLLVQSVKDLEIWRCEILKAQSQQKQNDYAEMSLTYVNHLLDGFRRYTSIIEVATSPLIHEDGVSGVLITNIHKVDGLNPDFKYSLSIEADSFKLNELKARTKSCGGYSSVAWNESFDIDLDCCQTLNILLYEVKNYGENKESLVGYFEFQLNSKDLYNKNIIKVVPMLGYESVKFTIEVSFKFEAKNELLKRQPSIMKASLFGISIKSIVSREKSKSFVPVENVPMIIVACFKKIEERGLDEEGIYRISGSKNDIIELYKKLNKNALNAIQNLGDYDLHTITGILKMYLRELPEPLMMSDNYERLMNISKIEEESERFKLYEGVINQLPEPNHSTVIFLLKHFQRVCSHSSKNQMIAGNLGLILGPTLILPPCNPDKQATSPSNIAVETIHSMVLARVFTHIMHGVCNGQIILK